MSNQVHEEPKLNPQKCIGYKIRLGRNFLFTLLNNQLRFHEFRPLLPEHYFQNIGETPANI